MNIWRKIICMLVVANTSFSATCIAAENTSFDAWKDRFVQALWLQYPAWASSVGFHKYDDQLTIPDAAERQGEINFCNAQLDSLHVFTVANLTQADQIDYHLIENQLAYLRWSVTDLKTWAWDPSSYNVTGSFSDLLTGSYAPADQRLRDFYARMQFVPAYYQAAKKSISNPTKEHTELAIKQNLGGITVFTDDLADALSKSGLSESEKTDMKSRAQSCVKAVQDYAQWLKTLKNEKPRSFRLGKELYSKKFEYEIQSRYTADEVYEKAVAHKKEVLASMASLTKQLWPKYFAGKPIPTDNLVAIKKMVERLSANYLLPDSFQLAIERQLPLLTAFIKNKNLLYMDPSKPLVVRQEPAYMGGVTPASINAPGPYDANGNTYYNVASLAGWDHEKQESFLREYNHYTLQILDIHEAIPGHYTQLVYANKSPSIIKSLFGNNAMIEGWAVYAERMMLENGYDGDRGPDSKEASPEMWLMYYKWHLRSTCNTILDYSVHTGKMTRDEALKMLENEAFQERTEAENKWKRVTLTQVQLDCYFTGFTEIYDLRKELIDRMKAQFNLREFNEKFLSYGSAPVKYIRELMLQDVEKKQ